MATSTKTEVAVERLDVSAYTIPTDAPEQDGTFDWDSTTIVVCEAHAGGETGLGYTYGDVATGALIESALADVVRGRDATDVEGSWEAMSRALRNDGRPGVGAMAMSAVDVALWDLKARLLGEPLVAVIDGRHDAVPIYGSGGFTSYPLDRIREQLGAWVADGIRRVKMKVGREPSRDPARLDAAREAIGPLVELFVDANGAFDRTNALGWAERYRADWDVSWFEEPVSSDDVEGLAFVRDRAPDGLEVAAGEYGYLLRDFEALVGAVDCLQADVTRCGGITGLRQVDALATQHKVDLSAHCAPAISAHAFCAVDRLRHLEYFHDHVRVEALLFDGVPEPKGGELRPDCSRPGHGLELRRADAARWAA
ncbi:MAG TPA: enolase C-terminal domain-like protein [Gaiellaceae bacterium]|nr:enolase C-terminal domain-like protein [Gaiellaceae bacterium]